MRIIEGGGSGGAAAFIVSGVPMRRALLSMILILLANSVGRAEDFTGFYAGINAGYAKGAERDRTPSASAPGPGAAIDRTGVGPDLPPSAVGAAAAMRRSDRTGSAAATPR